MNTNLDMENFEFPRHAAQRAAGAAATFKRQASAVRQNTGKTQTATRSATPHMHPTGTKTPPAANTIAKHATAKQTGTHPTLRMEPFKAGPSSGRNRQQHNGTAQQTSRHLHKQPGSPDHHKSTRGGGPTAKVEPSTALISRGLGFDPMLFPYPSSASPATVGNASAPEGRGKASLTGHASSLLAGQGADIRNYAFSEGDPQAEVSGFAESEVHLTRDQYAPILMFAHRVLELHRQSGTLHGKLLHAQGFVADNDTADETRGASFALGLETARFAAEYLRSKGVLLPVRVRSGVALPAAQTETGNGSEPASKDTGSEEENAGENRVEIKLLTRNA